MKLERKVTDKQTPLPKDHVEITDPMHVLRPGIDKYLSTWQIDSNGHFKWVTAEQLDAEAGPLSTWLEYSESYYRFCCPVDQQMKKE